MINDNMFELVDLKEVLPLIQKAWDFQAKGYGTAFIDMSGHVATINIKLYVHGWRSGRDEDYECELRLQSEGEREWMKFNADAVKKAIYRIEVLMEDLPTEIEIREKEEKARIEREKKRYEELKAKFES